MFSIFKHFGKYYMLMFRVFGRPEKRSLYWKQVLLEIDKIGIGSLGIVSIISLFMGAVILIQSAYGFSSPWVPSYAEGVATRDSIILEFAPTILSLILAGKVGSNISSEIGTMKVTEQIDALEIMGVNSAAFLIAPKIIASIIINPFLIIFSMFLGVAGGYIAAVSTGAVTAHDFIYGIQYDFIPFNVFFALVKAVVFAFIISSISSYHGYITEGGALEVGKASTKGVVYSSITILFFNVLLTQMFLS